MTTGADGFRLHEEPAHPPRAKAYPVPYEDLGEGLVVAEMDRVLRPGGWLVLLGHLASPYRVVRAIQRVIERWLLPVAGDHQTRQPLALLQAAGFVIDHDQRSGSRSSSGWWLPSPATGDLTATGRADATIARR